MTPLINIIFIIIYVLATFIRIYILLILLRFLSNALPLVFWNPVPAYPLPLPVSYLLLPRLTCTRQVLAISHNHGKAWLMSNLTLAIKFYSLFPCLVSPYFWQPPYLTPHRIWVRIIRWPLIYALRDWGRVYVQYPGLRVGARWAMRGMVIPCLIFLSKLQWNFYHELPVPPPPKEYVNFLFFILIYIYIYSLSPLCYIYI